MIIKEMKKVWKKKKGGEMQKNKECKPSRTSKM